MVLRSELKSWMGYFVIQSECHRAYIEVQPVRREILQHLARTFSWLARIIHDGSSRNRAVAMRDRRAEPRGREAYLKQYVDRPNGEPACLDAGPPRPGLSQRRIRDCSRSVHE